MTEQQIEAHLVREVHHRVALVLALLALLLTPALAVNRLRAPATVYVGQSFTVSYAGTGQVVYRIGDTRLVSPQGAASSASADSATVSWSWRYRAVRPGRLSVRVTWGKGAVTTAAVRIVQPVKLRAPAVTSVKPVSGSAVRVSWRVVSGADCYQVWYRAGAGPWKRSHSTARTSCYVKRLKGGVRYTFAVQAVSRRAGAVSSPRSAGKIGRV